MVQPAQTAQIARVVDHGLDPQRAPVFEVLLDSGVPVEGVDVDLGAVGDDPRLVFTSRRASPSLAPPEGELDHLRAADIEVVGHQGLEESPGAPWRVEDQREVSTWRIDSSHQ